MTSDRGARLGRRVLPAAGVAAVVTVIALGLGACTGPGGASEEPADPSTSATASAIPSATSTPRPDPEPTVAPTPGPVPSPVPDPAVDQNSAEGMLAALEYYLQLTAYMVGSGDDAEWTELTDPDCAWCRYMHEAAQGQWEQGHRSDWVGVRVGRSTEPEYSEALDQWRVHFIFHEERTTETDRDGNTIFETGPDAIEYVGYLEWHGRWVTRTLGQEEWLDAR